METLLLISGSIALLEKLVPYIQGLLTRAKQDAEMTPEQEAEFNVRLETLFGQPQWNPANFKIGTKPFIPEVIQPPVENTANVTESFPPTT
jgi:hypothetical protein